MAYVLSSGSNYSALKWGDDQLGSDGGRVTWSLSLTGLTYGAGFTDAQFIYAAQAAFNTWESYTTLDFEFAQGDADIDVRTTTLSGSTVGLATYFFGRGPDTDNGVSIVTSATVDMDLEATWSPFGERGLLSYYAVLLHEIGHAIGLGHVDQDDGPEYRDQIMNTPISADDLGGGDIAGAQILYGDPNWTDGANTDDLSGETRGLTLRLLGGDDVLTATNFADTIYGGAGGDTVSAGGGADIIIDVLGTNTLNGDNGDDVIISGGRTTASGGSGDDIVLGGSGNDNLSGDGNLGGVDGNDTLVGDPTTGFFYGDDVLTPGGGDDFIEGGGGADTFVFGPEQGRNTIAALNVDLTDPGATQAIGVDFESGIDVIQLIGFSTDVRDNLFSFVQDVSNGSGMMAQFEAQGTTIVFFGLTQSNLTESDFLI